jgi:hypothetical protein
MKTENLRRVAKSRPVCMGLYDHIETRLKSHSLRWTMENLHVRLNFNLSKEKGIKHHSYRKNIMELIKLQNLVAK